MGGIELNDCERAIEDLIASARKVAKRNIELREALTEAIEWIDREIRSEYEGTAGIAPVHLEFLARLRRARDGK